MDDFLKENEIPEEEVNTAEETAEACQEKEEIEVEAPETKDELMEELSEIRDMFQKELDRANSASEEELIQDLEYEEKATEEEEEIDEALLCECCADNVRSLEYGEDYPYCESCREAMKRYPLRASGFITLILSFALFVATLYFSGSSIETAPDAITALSNFSEGKTLSALYSAYNYTTAVEGDAVSMKLIKKSIEGYINTGYYSDAVNLIETYFSETELKLPHNKKYQKIIDDNDSLTFTYYKVTEVLEDAISGKEYDYDALMKELDSLKGAEENGVPYNDIFIEYYKYILMSLHKEPLEEQFAQLKKVDEIGKDYEWVYISNLCGVAAKISDEETVNSAFDRMMKINKEDSYIYLAKASYYRYLDEPNAEKILEVCAEAEENSYGGDLSYKQYVAIANLILGKNDEALKAMEEYTSSVYTVQNCNLYALCALAAGDEEVYKEMKSTLEMSGYKLSDAVENYKNGKTTIEEIIKDKEGDL